MSDEDPAGGIKESLAERIARKLAESRTGPEIAPRTTAAQGRAAAARPAAVTPPRQNPLPSPRQNLMPPPRQNAVPPPRQTVAASAAAGPAAPSSVGEAAATKPPPVIQIDYARLSAAGIITPETESSQSVEEYRFIKRQLMRLAFAEDSSKIRENGNVIMVTSSREGEGKSNVAMNIAISFSLELDFYVLLVDADNHGSGMTAMLGLDPQDYGLVDLLVDGNLQMRDIIRRTSIPNLSFIAAGRQHMHGSEILASKQMGAIMADMTLRYPDRIIVIDAPPLLSSTEGIVLSAHVGHAVVVVEKDKTTKKALQQALQRLEGCPEISCVLSVDGRDLQSSSAG